MEFKQIDVFLYYNISFIFSGKDNSGSYYERKVCMKGSYFYSVDFLY